MLQTKTLVQDSTIDTSLRLMKGLTADYPQKDFAVRFWDGSSWGDTTEPSFTLVLKCPGALRNMFTSPSEVSLGEAFINSEFDVDGDMERAMALGDFLLHREFSTIEKIQFASLLAKLPSGGSTDRHTGTDLSGDLHSKERDRRAISYHYDVSNEFFALWLDRSMTYSCAYFKSPSDDLDMAQEQKLDYLCKKLRLQPGEHLLDIGCGWGGLLLHAAQKYGVHAHGITLSVRQAEWARERIRRAGMTRECRVELCDYRDLDASRKYDKVVSVGMFEHVGAALLPEYFRCTWDLLRPGGVFLNHGIAVSPVLQSGGPGFVVKHVFPDSELVPLHVTLQAAEEGQFEVRDVENLREHYAMTLRQWIGRLEAKAVDAGRVVDEATYRVWRFFMAGAAQGFASGQLNLFQVLLSKPECGNTHLPLTRADWYGKQVPDSAN